MRIRSRFGMELGALVATQLLRSWMNTLEYKAVYYDPTSDPAVPECQGRKIYLFWHEYLLFPLCFRRLCPMTILASRHPDAEMLCAVGRHLGFEAIRGSTQRGGVGAIRELLRLQNRHLALTPDGPRGPRRTMSPGPIFLASKLGLPLVPIGFGYDRPWRIARAWDQFAIPRPFSRARAVVGPEVLVPPNLSRSQREHFRRQLEVLQNRLTEEAEAWAASGGRRIGQVRPVPGPCQNLQRLDPPHDLMPPRGLPTPAACPAHAPSQNPHRLAGP